MKKLIMMILVMFAVSSLGLSMPSYGASHVADYILKETHPVNKMEPQGAGYEGTSTHPASATGLDASNPNMGTDPKDTTGDAYFPGHSPEPGLGDDNPDRGSQDRSEPVNEPHICQRSISYFGSLFSDAWSSIRGKFSNIFSCFRSGNGTPEQPEPQTRVQEVVQPSLLSPEESAKMRNFPSQRVRQNLMEPFLKAGEKNGLHAHFVKEGWIIRKEAEYDDDYNPDQTEWRYGNVNVAKKTNYFNPITNKRVTVVDQLSVSKSDIYKEDPGTTGRQSLHQSYEAEYNNGGGPTLNHQTNTMDFPQYLLHGPISVLGKKYNVAYGTYLPTDASYINYSSKVQEC